MSFKRLYSYQFINNIGEREVDKLLTGELPYMSGNWYLVHQYLLNKHPNKKEGECDFILFCNLGVMVIEVKGSQVKFENNTFYQLNRRDNKWESKENPFMQARDNANAISEILYKNNFKDIFVGHYVIFPESNFPSRADLTDPFWSIDSEQSLGMALIEGLSAQILKERKNNYPKLNETRLELVTKLFSPKISDHYLRSQLKLTDSELKRKESENYRILEGLSENNRIMIEGPPGSAKSLYSIEMAKSKLSDKYSKLLYLSWNELLPSYISYKLKNFEFIDQATVLSYKNFLKNLIGSAGLSNCELTNEVLGNPKSIQELLKKCIHQIELNNSKNLYDYIIIDEAQDLFDKGLDEVLTHFAGDGKRGIENGSYIIFYDTTEGYKTNVDRDAFNFTLEYLRDNAAIYRMYEGNRPASEEGLKEFLESISRYDLDFKRSYGNDISIVNYQETTEILPVLKNLIKEILKSRNKKDVVVLFTSNLVSGLLEKGRILDGDLNISSDFEKITPSNLCADSEKVKYTTALTYKGLQRDTVVLVVNDLYNKNKNIIHELMIGASRARMKLYLLIDIHSVNKLM